MPRSSRSIDSLHYTFKYFKFLILYKQLNKIKLIILIVKYVKLKFDCPTANKE